MKVLILLIAKLLAGLLLANVCFAALEEFKDEILPCTEEFFDQCNALPPSSDSVLTCISPFRTNLPSQITPNHRECYKTCIYEDDSFGPFFPTLTGCASCLHEPVGTTATVLPNTMANTYNVFRLRSPGFDSYESNSICNYRIQCGAGQSMFYTIVNHNLQAEILSPTFNSVLCPDVLSVCTADQQTKQQTCGDVTSFQDEGNGFSIESLSVRFESNGDGELGGFVMIAFCVDDEIQNQDECTETGSKRRKRAAEDAREKRSAFRVRCIKVTPGQVVRYRRFAITVESTPSGRVLYRFPGIRVLQTYNRIEQYVEYRGDAVGREFPGFGELQIGYGIVYYIQTDINPAFLLSPRELTMVNDFVGNLTVLDFFAEDKFNLPLPGMPGAGGVTPPKCGELLSDLLELAQDERTNCRGFVSAAADFFLGTVESRCGL